MLRVGVLALQGGVIEHVQATRSAAAKLKVSCEVRLVRTKKDFTGLDCAIIPGGESTTLQKLLERANAFDELKRIPALFGTCAGAILLAKKAGNAPAWQKTLNLMNFEADRNAYGTQNESFETEIDAKHSELGAFNAVFIRAPKITRVESGVEVIATLAGEPIAVEQKTNKNYCIATTFHPELSTTLFHERFLRETTKQTK